MVKIAVISDTHDNTILINSVISFFKKNMVKTIIHCGDVVSPFILDLFIDFNFYLVKGNCDLYDEEFKRKLGLNFFDEVGKINILNHDILVYHGNNSDVVHKILREDEPEILLTGHTHQAMLLNTEKTLILNPGSLSQKNINNSFIILTLEENKNISLQNISFFDAHNL